MGGGGGGGGGGVSPSVRLSVSQRERNTESVPEETQSRCRKDLTKTHTGGRSLTSADFRLGCPPLACITSYAPATPQQARAKPGVRSPGRMQMKPAGFQRHLCKAGQGGVGCLSCLSLRARQASSVSPAHLLPESSSLRIMDRLGLDGRSSVFFKFLFVELRVITAAVGHRFCVCVCVYFVLFCFCFRRG